VTGSGVFDVGIGLIITFFLLSLICSGLNEFVAGLFNMRARFLTKSLGKLLGDRLQQKLYNHALIRGLSRTDVPTAPRATGEPAPREPRKKPAYIPTKTFALALQSLLANEAPDSEPAGDADDEAPTGQGQEAAPREITLSAVKAGLDSLGPGVRDSLKAVTDDVTSGLDEWRSRVETWYDETMSRVSGWYKRQIKWLIFVFAIAVTLALNADAIRIVNTLWRDKPVRDAVVARVQAVQATPIPCPTPTEGDQADPLDLTCVTDRVHQVEDLKLPLGYPTYLPWDWDDFPDDPRVPHRGWDWALKVLGLAITIAAISRGAPFWFDLLNRFANFRAAAKPPKTESTTS
jgi:hypothetical protein